ncbi:MAG: 6-phosphogluconolactonase [Frankiaceae bacterium]|nr:6-phosphogluconolactonase [Frankiaceae bacterium]MBV9869484.1 6-phosphogluconolactonase [Frankiaceae bacterium]
MSALVVVHRDATVLAQAVAARVITGLVDAQAARGEASIVLTGGGIGVSTLREIAESPARYAIDWPRLSVWWGDERFLPAGHSDRNETQARDALLAKVDLDPARIHPMPASDGPLGDDLEAAADAYAETLAAATHPEDHSASPRFDILLLGLGPDGHVASLFPESPALYDDRTVVPVRGAPKPPPIRLSLSLETINNAREVWIVAAGEEKAAAARLALSGAGPTAVPAAGVKGRVSTRWLLDRAAASRLPADLARKASP